MSLNNHFFLVKIKIDLLFKGRCKFYLVPETVAHNQHYRHDCVRSIKSPSICQKFKSNLVEDQSLWKVKENVIMGSKAALNELNFNPEIN